MIIWLYLTVFWKEKKEKCLTRNAWSIPSYWAGLKLVYSIKLGWSKAGLLGKIEPSRLLISLIMIRRQLICLGKFYVPGSIPAPSVWSRRWRGLLPCCWASRWPPSGSSWGRWPWPLTSGTRWPGCSWLTRYSYRPRSEYSLVSFLPRCLLQLLKLMKLPRRTLKLLILLLFPAPGGLGGKLRNWLII